MLFNIKHMRTWWPLATLIATLALAGCSDDDRKGIITPDSLNQVGSGEMFHGAEWATIKNLDPRGEQCIDCHGKSADMSPNGKLAHNIGLQKFQTHQEMGVDGLKILTTSIDADKDKGIVEVNLSKALPADANFNMVFAKLAPRIRHVRGHDWQNYLNAASSRSADNEKAVIAHGVSPQRAQGDFINVSTDRKKLTFDLKQGFGWGEHTFNVTDEDSVIHSLTVVGTKVTIPDLASHVSCYAANENSHQIEDSNNNKIICWWPDGSHLPSGVFVSDANDFIVAYEKEYTHRIGLAVRATIQGSPAFNTWYDFIPNQPNVVINDAWRKKYNDDFLAIDWRNNPTDPTDPHGQIASTAFQELPASREIVDIQSCNSCHDSLTRHGDRSEIQLCVTCHNPGNLEPRSGRSIDFKYLVHRIHRGTNLPSQNVAISATDDQSIFDIENTKGGHGLVSGAATDWTKVRFPQGPTPGAAVGITNCVKCHMGPETKRIVQEFADEIGPGNGYDVQEKLKLAKVTPQGDNWLGVRSIEACRACHDTVIWSRDAGQGDQADMAKAVPLYGDDYLGIGYEWVHRSGTLGQHPNVTVGTTAVNANGDQFTCGSGGGCHGNTNLQAINFTQTTAADNSLTMGDNGSNKIHRRHLRLTRDFIIAERFAIEISDPKVTGTTFTANVNIKDKKTGNNLVFDNDHKTTPDAAIGELSLGTFLSNGYIGWMHNSPDYNHSAGHNNSQPFLDIPGAPALAPVDWVNGKITVNLEDIPNDQWATIKDDLANVVGTLFVRANFNEGYNLQAATVDFRLDNSALAADEGRRKVVDFTAGNGPINVDNVDGWDKHDGANTQSCSSCHLQLSFHGGLAKNVQACVVCHNPQRTDINGRSVASGKAQKDYADGQYEESLDFKRFVHTIHAAGDGFRMDPLIHDTGFGSPESRPGDTSNSFPGVLNNSQSCHIKNETTGKWTFELDQIPEGMIGSTAITADWASIVPSGGNYDPDNKRSDFDNHLKMTPIASVCSSCHDAGNKSKPNEGRQNANILDGGPYVGSHWWVMGGIAPGIVRPNELPSKTKHQSGL